MTKSKRNNIPFIIDTFTDWTVADVAIQVLTFIQSSIMSPFLRAVMKLICYVRIQSDMQRISDSDNKRTPQSAMQTAPTSQGSLTTLHFKPTFTYRDSNATRCFEPAIFTQKNSNAGPTTGDGFHPESSAGPSDARRMEGGVAGLR